MNADDKTIIEIVCTNCGEPWTEDHTESCEFQFGVWLEAKAILRRERGDG